MNFARNNHYVPQSYLRSWAGPDGKVSVYTLVVPDNRYPLWERRSIAHTGSHKDLYTTTTKSGETDDLERWFNTEIEVRAKRSIDLAINDERMMPDDWHHLIRFYALQETRTPSAFTRFLTRWEDKAQQFLDETVQDAIPRFQELRRRGGAAETITLRRSTKFPFALHATVRPELGVAEFKAELVVGREYWQAAVQHIVTETYKALLNYKWTILRAPNGFRWPTTDHPSICTHNDAFLNGANGPGWGTYGAQLFMPVSPRHLLYTRVGFRPPARGTVLPLADALRLRRLLLMRAHRYIFSTQEDSAVQTIRPRHADRDMFVSELESWQELHERNSSLIRSLHNPEIESETEPYRGRPVESTPTPPDT